MLIWFEMKRALRRDVPESLKKDVAGRQAFRCANDPESKRIDYECPLWKNGDGVFDRSLYEIDHIVELADGGSNSEDNLQALCRSCHGVKTANSKRRRLSQPQEDFTVITDLIVENECQVNTTEVIDIIRKLEQEEIVTDLYQRDPRAGWKSLRENYIVSWITGQTSGVIVLSKRDDRQYIVDGQHRITAIHDFVRGTFNVKLGGVSVNFEDLPEKDQRRLTRKTMHCEIHTGLTQQVEQELFKRINTGAALSAGERVGANLQNPLVYYVKKATAEDSVHCLNTFNLTVLKDHQPGRATETRKCLIVVVNIILNLCLSAPEYVTDMNSVKLGILMSEYRDELEHVKDEMETRLRALTHLFRDVRKLTYSEFIPIFILHLRGIDISNDDIKSFFTDTVMENFKQACVGSAANGMKNVRLRQSMFVNSTNVRRRRAGKVAIRI